MNYKIKEPKLLIIDLFCGAGGTTTGFENNAECSVIACVNHDENAIKSHLANHPNAIHYTEDMRTLDITGLSAIADREKAKYPDALLILWASLECTNFSKAKGGQPRDADSRTLADHLERYVQSLSPDYIMIENVVEFMSWGPLDDNGKPVSRKNGQDFMRWENEMSSFGYRAEWKELNSANYGAYTSRNRLFGIFGRPDLPIAWPAATHSKKPSHSLYDGSLQKWKAVKEVLDFTDEGKSIFDRKKDLSDKTLERIYAGLIKFVAGGKDAFLMKWNSMSAKGVHVPPDMEAPCPVVTAQNRLGIAFIQKHYSGRPEGKVTSVEDPAGTITTSANQSLIQTQFIVQRNSGNPDGRVISVEGPARTLTATAGNQEVVNTLFIQKYHGNGDNLHSIDNPCPTIATKDQCAIVNAQYLISYHHSSTTNDVNNPFPTLTCKDRDALVKPCFIMRDFTNGGFISSIESPVGAILPFPKTNMVTAEPFIMNTNFDNGPSSIDEPLSTITANRKWQYLINPSWGGNGGSVDLPCPVIVARQDKAPLYLVALASHSSDIAIRVDETDTPIMLKIKEFMVIYGIVDIKMRMLKIPELLKIQGFPADYTLIGTQADQKKFIGNSVHPLMPDHMASAILDKLNPKTRAA